MSSKQDCIPVGCVPPACCPISQHALLWGVYLLGGVPAQEGSTCLGGVPAQGDVPAQGVPAQVLPLL